MSGRRRSTPELFGLAGAVERRRSRASGTTITLYDANEAGMESDPQTPWATVCEEHGSIVCHGTRSAARASMAVPDWCEACQEKMSEIRATRAALAFAKRHEDCDCASCLPPTF